MSFIADGILILTCLTTAVYCYVLSRRLRRLSSTDEGIGQQIKQMNSALEETRGAQREMNTQVKGASDKLMREVASARKAAKELASRLDDAQKTIATLERVKTTAARGYPAETQDPVQDAVTPNRNAAKTPAPEPKKVVQKPAAAPAQTQPEEEDFDDADMDLSDALDSGSGEQQLGFLPDIDVKLGEDEQFEDLGEIEDFEAETEGAPQPDGATSEDRRADTPAAVPAEAAAATDAAADRGLLKVERVAL